MYSKNERVVITSEDEVIIKGKIVSTSEDSYIIHSDGGKYIAADYNIKKNKAKLVREDKSEIKISNLKISKLDTENNKRPEMFVEEVRPQEGIAIINVQGRKMTVSIDKYENFVDFIN